MTLERGRVGASFLMRVLVFLLFAALASATVTKRAHRHATTLQKGHAARGRHVSRFHHVHVRMPSRRTSKRRRAASRSRRHSRVTRSARGGRRPGLEIAPSRTQQIQQALIQAGDLREQPTGRWDSQTRDAMRLYQQQNGFQATGLPDAKSLMKMGLGPHPLPLQADPLAQQAQAGVGVSPTPSTGQQSFPSQ